ncbi:MAG: hypothetical protein ACFFCY_15880 [Promethearchaeota archaeon]
MKSRSKRLLPFYIIATIIIFFLLYNLFRVFSLEEGSPHLEHINLINTILTFSLFFVGILGYFIDKKFELIKNEEKRKLSKNFTKYEKLITIITIISISIMSASILLGEYLLFILGPNIFTDIFIVLEIVGIGLFILGIVLILK